MRARVNFIFAKGSEGMTKKIRQNKKARQQHRHPKTHRHKSPNFSGQHFIHNKKLISKIVELANVGTDDLVLDLGAGKGALTSLLSQRAGRVLAVEYDHALVQFMQGKFQHQPNTRIIQQDILRMRLPKEPFVVVSNIPFAITTPIMKMLLNQPTSGFQRGVIVMEKGAAIRFTSTQWIKDPYVIAWRMWFEIRYIQEIASSNFSPPPKVSSALVMINRRHHPLVPVKDCLAFWGLAEHLLNDPGQPIGPALRGIFTAPQIAKLRNNLALKHDPPVGSLSEVQWSGIFDAMTRHVPRFRWPRLSKGKLREILGT